MLLTTFHPGNALKPLLPRMQLIHLIMVGQFVAFNVSEIFFYHSIVRDKILAIFYLLQKIIMVHFCKIFNEVYTRIPP